MINPFAPAVAGFSVMAAGAPLQIVSEPDSVSANVGSVVVLGVGVTPGQRSFRWFRERAGGQAGLVSVNSTGFLRLDPLRAADAGTYFAVIADPEGNSVRSRSVTVSALLGAD